MEASDESIEDEWPFETLEPEPPAKFIDYIDKATRHVEWECQTPFACPGCRQAFINWMYDESRFIINDPIVRHLLEVWSQWNQYWSYGCGSKTMQDRLYLLFQEHQVFMKIEEGHVIILAMAHYFNAIIQDKHHPIDTPPQEIPIFNISYDELYERDDDEPDEPVEY